MRALILTAIFSLGAVSVVNAAVCQNPNTGRAVRCPATAGVAMPGIGRTVVLAGPAVRARPVARCGRYRCGRVVTGPVAVRPAVAPVAQPAPGYAPQ
jgi:hypothetical protein